MSYNNYSLRQLLELAFRDPEIGAVNFNILYHILKTIIQKDGLSGVKPVVNFDTPLNIQDKATKSKLKEVPLKRPFSAESLQSVNATGITEKPKNKEDLSTSKTPGDKQKDNFDWNMIKILKRLDGVEEEVSSIHNMIEQLVNKIASVERIADHRETKVLKKIADLKYSIKSRKEEQTIPKTIEPVSPRVPVSPPTSDLKSEHKKREESQESKKSERKTDSEKRKESEGKKDSEKRKSEGKKDSEKREESEGKKDSEKREESEVKKDSEKREESEGKKDSEKREESEGKKDSEKEVESEEKKYSEKRKESKEDEHPEFFEYHKPDESFDVIKETVEVSCDHEEEMAILSAKYEKLSNELNTLKEFLMMKSSITPKVTDAPKILEKPDEVKYDIVKGKAAEVRKESTTVDTQDNTAQIDVSKRDLEMLNINFQISKLVERCSAFDKLLSGNLKEVKEKNSTLECSVTKYEAEMEALKLNMDEIVHSLENLKENVQSVENEMASLTEIPGLINRVEQLEGYVYTEHEYKRRSEEEIKHTMQLSRVPPAGEKFVSKAEKVTEKITVSDKKDVETLKPLFKTMEKTQVLDLEASLGQDVDPSASGLSSSSARRKFMAASRNIALTRNLAKKKTSSFKLDDMYKTLAEDDQQLYEEPVYETEEKTFQEEDFDALSQTAVPLEMTATYSEADIKASPFMSLDILEEHSRQLKGQVIVFVKRRLHGFELELQRVESNAASMKKKIEILEKGTRETGEKVMLLDANFNQRARDLAAVKEMTENHHVSISTLMNHLDRKAEAYTVNQKVNRKELTAIEDRVRKLCMETSTEISTLEEKICDSVELFQLELDKKLFTVEFEARMELLLHRMKIFDSKLKDTLLESPLLDCDGINAVEIKKYIMNKDGTRTQKAARRIGTWKSDSAPKHFPPVIGQHFSDQEMMNLQTARQVKRRLELAALRGSKPKVGWKAY